MATTGSRLGSKRPNKEHLMRGTGGVAAEVGALKEDVASLAAMTVEEFTNVATADADGIKTSVATVASATTYSGSALNGVVGGGRMSPPRNITITTAGVTPANAPATATINGKDINGADISETITVAQTATIAVGNKAFAKVTSIVLPAADGTAATLTFGFGDKIGLGAKIKTRAGATVLLREIEAGSLVTTGTMASASVGAPNGTYLPSNVPNDTRDYAIYYEKDV